MIGELTDAEAGIAAELCVIGTGPAGFALLGGLARRGAARSALFLESAGGGCPPLVQAEPGPAGLPFSRRSRAYFSDVQDLYDGAVGGWIAHTKPDYLRESRLRALGGSGNVWTGWLCPYLPGEDEDASGAFSDWPFPYRVLAAHHVPAMRLLGIDPALLAREAIARCTGLGGLPREPLARHRFHEAHALLAPFDFRRRFLAELGNSPGARLLFGASAVAFDVRGATVDRCRVRGIDRSGRMVEREVRARHFVVATGAIEAARLLLASGLDRRLPQLGRNFVEHPYLWNAGRLHPGSDGAALRAYLAPAAARVAPGVAALPFVVRLPDGEAAGLPVRFVTGGLAQPEGTLNASWETARYPGARLMLDWHAPPDRLGMPRVRLESGAPAAALRIADLAACAAEYAELADALFGSAGYALAPFGEPLPRWPAAHRLSPGNHPSGTCRMSHVPADGVVDADGRVHGIDNLFVAGAAVFPASSYANPTLTVLALADRLAAHLAAVQLSAGT